MSRTVPCEHCGNVVAMDKAEQLIVEDWTHYFCSELCKIQWGELAELEREEE